MLYPLSYGASPAPSTLYARWMPGEGISNCRLFQTITLLARNTVRQNGEPPRLAVRESFQQIYFPPAFALASVIFLYSSGSWLRVQKTSPHSS